MGVSYSKDASIAYPTCLFRRKYYKPLCVRLTIDCGQAFSSVQELLEHASKAHKEIDARVANGNGKRKFVDDSVTPIIQAMPAEVARKHRAVFDGPSRTLSIGQSSKRRK